jgi:uncharacterized membrane protein
MPGIHSSNQHAPRQLRSELISIIILVVIIGLIIWSTITWNSDGTHNKMLSWVGSGKGPIVILYNLTLMLVTGILLGVLMGKITTLFTLFINKNKSN